MSHRRSSSREVGRGGEGQGREDRKAKQRPLPPPTSMPVSAAATCVEPAAGQGWAFLCVNRPHDWRPQFARRSSVRELEQCLFT